MIELTEQLARAVGVQAACAATGAPRASLYRFRKGKAPVAKKPRPSPKRALTESWPDINNGI